MPRPKGSKNKPKLKQVIENEIVKSSTPKKRGRKPSVKRKIPIVSQITELSSNKNIAKKISDLKSENDKPKRKRRTKVEILRDTQLQETSEVITDKKKTQKSLTSILPKMEVGKSLFQFENYTLTKFDPHNFALWYSGNKDRKVFLGYYALTINGFKQAVTTIALRLITKTDDSSFKGLISANQVLKALDFFRVFLDTQFKT